MAPSKADPPGLRRSTRIADKTATAKVTKKSTRKARKARLPPLPIYECIVCYRQAGTRSFPNHLCTDACKHLIKVCKNCLKQHISAQLETKMFDALTCPECPEILDGDCVAQFGTKQDSLRYEKLRRKTIAERNPGWFWCLNPRCDTGHVHEALLAKDNGTFVEASADSNTPDPRLVFTCDNCTTQSCISCERLWHTAKTCAEVMRALEQENAASLATIAKECKPCPSCAKQIEKNGGCDSVYCTQCGTNFCWRCATSYNTINSTGKHGDGCIYNLQGRMDPHQQPMHFPVPLPAAAGGPMHFPQQLHRAPQGGLIAPREADWA